VVLDCAGLSPNLVEAELFGHARGAFTGALTERHGVFETASGGTVFIDEVGELPVDLQAKLLRVLQEKTVRRLGESKDRKVDVRVVSATHRPLARMIKSGGFRADLYYRLGVIEVRVPPLRERRDEIPFLVEQFLRQQTPPRDLSALPAHALALLSAHDWPGNVRELRSVVTRLMLFPEEGLTSALRSHPEGAPTEQADPFARFAGMPLRAARDLFVADLERRLVTDALRRARGNVSKAAAALGLSRQFLHRLLKLYGVERDED
jgi:DNA-binding NtrC family response regulator